MSQEDLQRYLLMAANDLRITMERIQTTQNQLYYLFEESVIHNNLKEVDDGVDAIAS